MDACASFGMTDRCYSEHSFLSFQRMRGIHSWMLHFVQHDKLVDASFVQHDKTEDVIPNTLFCHSERSEGSSAWMLRFAQHDKLVDASLRSA